MTKERLEQYKALGLEIAALRGEIASIDANGQMVTDTVTSSSEWPYSPHKVKIRGIAPSPKTTILRNRLHRQRVRAEEERIAIEEFIAGIDDSELRVIFRLKYIEDLPWKYIGDVLHADRTTVAKRHDRYLKDSHNSR